MREKTLFKAIVSMRMPLVLVLLGAASSAAIADGTPSERLHTRCGWFDNPSPGNATLTDRDGEWTVAQQGTSSATGRWPRFTTAQWVQTGSGSAGHGCACLKVRDDAGSATIVDIVSARAAALSKCRQDKALVEPVNPLQ